MAIYILFIGLILITSLKLRCNNDSEILNVSDTITINGIFTLLIFFSHSTQYWPLSSCVLDNVYRHIQNIHNQWVVTTFLAFSGYGVMRQIMNNSEDYLKTYPYKRLLKTFINFDIAVVLYWIVSFLLGIHYNFIVVIGSLFGITSVGNSNWYIFAILVLYIFSYIAALIFQDNYNKQVLAVLFFTVIYIILMWFLGFEMRFYSTVMCYSLGAFLALYKEQIIGEFHDKKLIALFPMALVILITYKLRFNTIIMNISSMFFVLVVVWFLCFFKVNSRIFYFLGKHAFSIFIMQRIPGMIFCEIIGDTVNKYFIICADLLITIGVALLYDKVLCYVDKKIIDLFEGEGKNGFEV